MSKTVLDNSTSTAQGVVASLTATALLPLEY